MSDERRPLGPLGKTLLAIGVLLALALAGVTLLAWIEKTRVRTPEAAKHWVWSEEQESLKDHATKLFPELNVALIATPTSARTWPANMTLELSEGGRVLLRVDVWEVPRTGGRYFSRTAIARSGSLVLVSEFSPISTGCSISAYDLESGMKVWHTDLEGLGPIDHSKYSNRVQMEVIDRVLVVRGWEAAGRYIECLSISDGRRVWHEKQGPP